MSRIFHRRILRARDAIFAAAWLLVCAMLALSAHAAAPTKLGDLNGDGVLDVFDLTVLRQHIRQITPIAENLKPFADVTGDGFLNEDDAVALIHTIVGKSTAKLLPLATVRETSPFAGEGGVALTREVIVRFTQPLSFGAVLTTWDANTQTTGHFYAAAAGAKLRTRVELSGDRTKATLFFLDPIPASTRITATFDGAGLADLLERPLDADGDSAAGGVFTFTSDPAPITAVAGTGVVGHVYASEKAANGSDVPVPGALVRVVGSETLFTFTAADGSFSLTPCPAGRFFVEVDGRTSPASVFPTGNYYPSVSKAWEALPGRADNLAVGTGKIYLPRVAGANRTITSPIQTTTVTAAGLPGVELKVPPNSLFADDGTRGGSVVMAPVAPDRLPEPLPPGLNFPQVITIQTDGATNFDRPVPVKFPNLPAPVSGKKLGPGEKSALWSFNHDVGTWEIVGPMTVSEDGSFVVSDVGVGIRQPGWHGTQPGSQGDGPETPPPTEPKCPKADILNWQYALDVTGTAAGCAADFVNVSKTVKAVLKGLKLVKDVKDHVLAIVAELEAGKSNRAALRLALIALEKELDSIEEEVSDSLGIVSPLEKVTAALECCENALALLEPFCEGTDSQPECFSRFGLAACELRSFLEEKIGVLRILSATLQSALVDATFGVIREYIELANRYLEKTAPKDALRSIRKRRMIRAAATEITTDAELFAKLRTMASTLAYLDSASSLGEGAALSDEVVQKASAFTGVFGDAFIALEGAVPRAYLRIEYGSTVFRIRADAAGKYRVILPPSTPFVVKMLAPTTLRTGVYVGVSAPNGVPTKLHGPAAGASNNSVDSDTDGLSDLAEEIIGTNSTDADTDHDGISDGTEVSQGTDPLSGLAVQTGVVGTVDTPGNAVDVAAQNNVVVVADGAAGVAIYNVANTLSPVRIAQVDTPGTAKAVAMSANLVAVADGTSGLQVIDYTLPDGPVIVGQRNFGTSADAVAVAGSLAYTGLANGQIAVVDLLGGTEIERVNLPAGPVYDLTIAGDTLYAVTPGKLHALPLAITPLAVSGSATFTGAVGAGGRRLRVFAGGGLAYVTFTSGYNIFSLATPSTPVFVRKEQTTQQGWRHLVANGSGLGFAAVGANSTDDGAHDVSLYDLRPIGTTTAFLTTFSTPGSAEAVSIFNGLGFVADGPADLSVVNYLAYDALGVPPTISISTGFPTVGGALQAEEGKLGRVTAQVADDVQVRNVEFYVDGVRVVTDGNFPFEHRFITPLLNAPAAAAASATLRAGRSAAQPCCGGAAAASPAIVAPAPASLAQVATAEAVPPKTSFTLRAKATDTGGNSTWSDEITVNLVADATAPRVTKFLPPNGAFTGSLRTLSAVFSEPINAATLDASTFTLTGAGPDGIFGNADDVSPAGGALSYRESSNSAFLAFAADLPPGTYRLTISPPLSDLAGNAIATSVDATVRVFSFADGDGDGVPDDVEVLLALDPNNPDTDRDGIRDGQEDFDNDGLNNAGEIFLGTNPTNRDSDSDGIADGNEDEDLDGLNNGAEAIAGSDPFKIDTDGDGLDDATEVATGTSPLSPTGTRFVVNSTPVSYLNAITELAPPGGTVTLFSQPVSYLNAIPDAGIFGATLSIVSQPVSYLNAQDGGIPAGAVLQISTGVVSYRNNP